MIALAVVVPQPPLLVPQLASGATVESAPMREACLAAAARLGVAASRWVVVGADRAARRSVPPQTRGSFRGYGADVVVGLGPAAAGVIDPELALPLLVAGWLRGCAAPAASLTGELLGLHTTPGHCRAFGTEIGTALAAESEPVGLLVVGDGAATHTATAPGHLDDRAFGFDHAVRDALRTADTDGLFALDAELAAELAAVGRAPWQVLAGAALAAGSPWSAELLYSAAPYGVAYHVAVWTPTR